MFSSLRKCFFHLFLNYCSVFFFSFLSTSDAFTHKLPLMTIGISSLPPCEFSPFDSLLYCSVYKSINQNWCLREQRGLRK